MSPVNGSRRRGHVRRRWISGLALCLVVAGCNGTAQPVAAPAGESASTPDCGAGFRLDMPTDPLSDQPTDDPLPAVVVARLEDCTPESSASWVGEPLVLNFWASWCEPCKDEMPALASVAAALGNEVRFIGITFNDDPADSRAFLRDEVSVPWDNYVDANGQDLFRALAVRGTPSTVLVDAAGTVVHRHGGPITDDQLIQALSTHLGIG